MFARKASGRNVGLGVIFGIIYALGNEFVRSVAIGALTLSAIWWCLNVGWRFLRISRFVGASIRRLEVGQHAGESSPPAFVASPSIGALAMKWACCVGLAAAMALTGHAVQIIAGLWLVLPFLLIVDGIIYLGMKSRLSRLQGYANVLGRVTSVAA